MPSNESAREAVISKIQMTTARWRATDHKEYSAHSDSIGRRAHYKMGQGHHKYGGLFVGDPLAHARDEIADLINYMYAINLQHSFMIDCLTEAVQWAQEHNISIPDMIPSFFNTADATQHMPDTE